MDSGPAFGMKIHCFDVVKNPTWPAILFHSATSELLELLNS
jgi:hypothetical protein